MKNNQNTNVPQQITPPETVEEAREEESAEVYDQISNNYESISENSLIDFGPQKNASDSQIFTNLNSFQSPIPFDDQNPSSSVQNQENYSFNKHDDAILSKYKNNFY